MSRKFKILIFFSFSLIVWIFLAPLLAQNLIVEKPLEKADVILVLSGSSVYKERTRKAAKVYKNGVSKKILLTDDGEQAGWSQTEQRNPPFFYLAKKELIKQGVPEEHIEILKPEVTGTIYEAQALRKKIERENLNSVLLVTSAYHTKRSLWTFENILEKDVQIGIVSTIADEKIPSPFFWWLTGKGWKWVGGEYLKYLYYWIYY